MRSPARPQAIVAAAASLAVLVACAHGSSSAPYVPGESIVETGPVGPLAPAGSGITPVAPPLPPQPDVAAVREAIDAEHCRPGESSSACPPDSFEPQPYVSARAYSHLLAALLMEQVENYAGAAAELREALLYDPESAHLHTQLADALVHVGRIGDAEEELRHALQLDAQHAPAHVLAARIAEARGHATDARVHLRAAIEAQPELPEAYRELVHLEASLPDPDAAAEIARALEAVVHAVNARSQAAEKLEARAEEHPGLPEPDPEGTLLAKSQRLREEAGRAWEEAARTFASRHDDKHAEEAFAHAEALDPAGMEQVSAHALFLETRRRFADARAEELKLLARRPEAPEVLAALARMALEAGDAETAEAHLRKLIDLAAELEPPSEREGHAARDAAEPPERNEERRELAGALLRAGLPLLGARRPGAAAPAFDAALRLLPEQPELVFYRALALVGRGRAKEAAQQLAQVAQALDSKPQQSPALLGIEPAALALDARVQAALAKGRAGEIAESLRELRALFAAHPLDEGAALGLLEGCDRAGRAAEAIPLVSAALNEHPGDPTLLFTLGSAQDRAGQAEDALQTMRRLLARAPDHAGALNYVGYALVEKGGAVALQDARRLLERAVELRPDDGAIADSYGLCLLKLGHAPEALVELRRADALTPGDPVVLGHLGDALLSTGERDAAEEAFRRALDRLQPQASSNARGAHHGRAASRSTSASADEPLEERAPEANDARVKAELTEKLRALTAH